VFRKKYPYIRNPIFSCKIMRKTTLLFVLLFFCHWTMAQELLAQVQVNAQVMGGSNQQVYKTLEKNLKDFINNTSWTGKKLQNFEKIKCNFAIVIGEKDGNRYKGAIVVQSIRPVYGSTYESPMLNINDTKFSFEYIENENLIFNERQFSGKNLIDVISFYIYLVLGYDADSFQDKGGSQWFGKAQQIAQNAQNRGFENWATTEGPKSRGSLINDLLNPNYDSFRNMFYAYHRAGLDNLQNQDPSQAKKIIADQLMKLKLYENTFQQSYPINIFIDAKSDEIFNIFDSNNNGSVNMGELKQVMMQFAPKYTDSKWNKWK
jgi:hypothetical protein